MVNNYPTNINWSYTSGVPTNIVIQSSAGPTGPFTTIATQPGVSTTFSGIVHFLYYRVAGFDATNEQTTEWSNVVQAV